MKSVQFFAGAAMIAFMASCGEQPATETTEVEEKAVDNAMSGTYVVNTDDSYLTWEGNMLEIGGISLYGHNGKIMLAKGEITADAGAINGGMVVVDMTTITPEDENYRDEEGGRQSDLVGHLSSDDFFAVNEYPTSTFSIKQAEDGKIYGELTIRDQTKEVEMTDVEMSEEDGVMHAKGNFEFDRQEFNVKFKMPAQDKVLSDKIRIGFDIKAEKQNA